MLSQAHCLTLTLLPETLSLVILPVLKSTENEPAFRIATPDSAGCMAQLLMLLWPSHLIAVEHVQHSCCALNVMSGLLTVVDCQPTNPCMQGVQVG